MNNNKIKILDILRRERGKYITGSKIGNELSVSRAFVHQKINSLRDDGYQIFSKKLSKTCSFGALPMIL
jgi:biotin operon repressor